MSEHSFAAIESLLHTNTIALSAFGTWLITFLGGENGALLAILLGLEGLYPLGVAIVFSFLGSLSADVFWYWMTTGAIRPWFERRFKKYFSGTHEKNARSFFVLADKHPYLLLTLIKFLVGIRLVLTILASRLLFLIAYENISERALRQYFNFD